MTKDGRKPIQIGAITGDPDPESRELSRAIGTLSLQTSGMADFIHYKGITLDLQFLVDGRFSCNDFTGVQVGSFLKAKQVLIVQMAMDKDPSPAGRAKLLQLLADAVDAAEAHLIRRKLAPGLPAARAVVAQLQADPFPERFRPPPARPLPSLDTAPADQPRADPILRAKPEVGDPLDDPSESAFELLLDDIEQGEGTFLIVERTSDPTGMTYMQVLLQSDQTWLVEYQEGSLERHWTTIAADTEMTCQLLTAWAFELDGWHDLARWTPLSR